MTNNLNLNRVLVIILSSDYYPSLHSIYINQYVSERNKHLRSLMMSDDEEIIILSYIDV